MKGYRTGGREQRIPYSHFIHSFICLFNKAALLGSISILLNKISDFCPWKAHIFIWELVIKELITQQLFNYNGETCCNKKFQDILKVNNEGVNLA